MRRSVSWWRHQMETFSVLLALCEREGVHRWPVDIPHKSQWRGALLFSLICTWTNCWVNTRDASDLRRHWAHYDVTVMNSLNADPVYIWDAYLVNNVPEDDLALISNIAIFSTKSLFLSVILNNFCWPDDVTENSRRDLMISRGISFKIDHLIHDTRTFQNSCVF